MAAGRATDAERSYREDLDRFPDNGWSLFGLVQALSAQHRDAEVEEVQERFAKAWATADAELSASRF